MVDFVSVWVSFWESVLGYQPILVITDGVETFVSFEYATVTGYVLCGALFLWLLYLSVWMFRDFVCGVLRS